MRFFGIISVAAAGLWLAACADEDASARVAETISWRLSGQGTHAAHTQASVKETFRVTCSRGASGLSLRIEDPGFKGSPTGGVENAMRPGGVIEIRNGNPGANSCNVTVKDTDQFGNPYISYTGTCGTECNLMGEFNYMGWDFSGQLSCSTLTVAGSGPLAQSKFMLIDPNTNGPVQISVSGCSN
jgi:hypothetical protein